MAKKKGTRRIVRRLTSSAKKGYRRAKSSGVKPEQLILPAGVYGAVREKVSNVLTPVTSKIPLGSIADEVVLGTIHYFGAKKFKNKMAKDFFRAGLCVEAARIGEAVVDGSAFSALGSSKSSGSVVDL